MNYKRPDIRFVLLAVFVLIIISSKSAFAIGVNINPGIKVDVNTVTFNVAGDINIKGTVEASSGTISVNGAWSNSGVFTPGTGTVAFTGQSSDQAIGTDTTSFYNLVHSGTSKLAILKAIDIDGNFTNSAGTFNTNSNEMKVAGNWTNFGTFLPGTGTVTLDGRNQTLFGAGTFYVLNKSVTVADTLTFEKSVTQKITNKLILQGAQGNLLSLRSSSSPSLFGISLESPAGAQTLAFLDVKDSDASGGLALIGGNDSVDSGNNLNWILPKASPTPTTTPTPAPDGPPRDGDGGLTPTPTPTPTPLQEVPAPGRTITGNVVDAKFRPVSRIFIDAYDFFNGKWIDGASTDSFGNYTISNIPAGTYKVGVDTSGTSFVEQFYDNAEWATASKINVSADSGRGGIDFILLQGNFIRGNVTDNTGKPISGIFVDAFNADNGEWVNDSMTDGQGNYSITIPTGSFKVSVSTFGTNFLPEFFIDVRTFEEATEVKVTSNKNAENINFVLSTGNAIVGKVVDASNNPLPGFLVNVFDVATNVLAGSDETGEDGKYSISVLPGRYNVSVDVFGTDFNTVTRENVVVKTDSDPPAINFILSIANSIKGRITDSLGTPLPDIFVEVFIAATGKFAAFDVTDFKGDYSIPVQPNSYNVDVVTLGTTFQRASQSVSIAGADVTADFTLKQGGVIRGIVTDGSNNPILGIPVNAFDFDSGSLVSSGVSDVEGAYLIPVSDGTYKVGVDTFGVDFAPVFYDGADWESAKPVLVLNGSDESDIDFSLSVNSRITGDVSIGATPLGNIILDIFDFDSGTWINSGRTNENGNFTVPVLPGNYKVGTFAREEGFVDEFYNDQDFDSADSVRVLPEEAKPGIDFEMAAGGSISGRVTNGSTPIEGIEVNAIEFDSHAWVSSGITNSNGEYTINGLPSGNYLILAVDPVKTVADAPPGGPPRGGRSEGIYNNKFFDNALFISQATPVSTTNGEVKSGIDITVSLGGTISGQVVGVKTNDVVKGAAIEAYESKTGLWSSSVTSDDSGKYTISLPAGFDYKLRAIDNGNVFTSQYYSGAVNLHEASALHVDASTNTADINFTLRDNGNFISGFVSDLKNKPLRGVKVDIFDFDTGSWIDSVVTNLDGKYKRFIPAGKYRVGTLPFDSKFLPDFHRDSLGWDDAAPVFVSDTFSAQNINFRLGTGSAITGVVKDKSGAVLPEINVQVFDYFSNSWVNESITGKNGQYSVIVPPGEYRLRTAPLDKTSKIGGEFYDSAKSWNLSTPITVAMETAVTLNDIVLFEGNSINGSVVNEASESLVNVRIDVFDFKTGFWINSTITDKDGNYIVQGLQNGSYRVKALPFNRSLAGMFFDNADNWDGAKRVDINSVDKDNVNFILPKGGLIKGKVTDSTTGGAISGVEVSAYNLDSGNWINRDITGGNGNYTIQVPVGAYIVRANASGTIYADMFFSDTLDVVRAKAAVVTLNRDFNANFRLSAAAKINGSVKDRDNFEIQGAKINIYNFDTNVWVNSGLTDIKGEYSINVPSGQYRFEIIAPVDSDFIDVTLDASVKVTAPDAVKLAGIVLLEGRGAIIGTVRDNEGAELEGIKVSAFNFDSGSLVGDNVTNAEGSYSISVPPGRYRVKTFSQETGNIYVNKLFDDVTNWVDASAINVSKDVIRTADFILNRGFVISGRVRSSEDFVPMPGVSVHIFQSDTMSWITSGKTDGKGNFSISVPNGVYRIWAVPRDMNFKPKFFSNTESFNKAKSIVVSGSDITDVNFDLPEK